MQWETMAAYAKRPGGGLDLAVKLLARAKCSRTGSPARTTITGCGEARILWQLPEPDAHILQHGLEIEARRLLALLTNLYRVPICGLLLNECPRGVIVVFSRR
jgi:hypothetical protein